MGIEPERDEQASDWADRNADENIPEMVAVLDDLIVRVRTLSPSSAFCLLMGRDELITYYLITAKPSPRSKDSFVENE